MYGQGGLRRSLILDASRDEPCKEAIVINLRATRTIRTDLLENFRDEEN